MSEDAQRRQKAAVIGGGPAGLIAAETLARAGVTVTVYDQTASVGRKFLLAGRGGLNLTHGEDLAVFLSRYGGIDPLLRNAIEAFPPSALRVWADGLGQETFVGSSGRVFPKAMKASPLLRAWLRRLAELGVTFQMRHRWRGRDGETLRFTRGAEEITTRPDITILALGGASWPRLGSDAGWVEILRPCGVDVVPLAASNAGVTVTWSEPMKRFAGAPLKRIAVSCGGRTARGEAIVTSTGLEGGAIYALSARLRDELARNGDVTLAIDLRPDETATTLAAKLGADRGKQSLANRLRKAAALPPVATSLLHEATLAQGKRLAALNSEELGALIKSVPVRVIGLQPVATAISTAGGIRFSALDQNFMLKKMPGVFAAGEMLDWDAPTGGYLLQASFATGVAAARGALVWLRTD